MQPDSRELKSIRIDSFAPGIADRSYEGATQADQTQNWPIGTAQTETYGCRALPNGSLAPLPRLGETSFTLDYPSPAPGGESGLVTITGFLIQGPVRSDTVAGGYDEANYCIGLEWLTAAGAGTNHRQARIKRIHMFSSDEDEDIILSVQDNFNSGVHRTAYLESTRAAATDATVPGFPGFAYAWYGDVGTTTGYWGIFPNPAAPSTLTPATISNIYNPGPMIVYQGRSVIAHRLDYVNGNTDIHFQSNELIFFTNSNLTTLASANASTFTPEDPGEIMAMCVSSANEVFVLKRRHGAFDIRGDIDQPTALRLPGVPGVGRNPQQPIASPIGVVYTAIGAGVYAWTGGDTSELVSRQLNPGNFDITLPTVWQYNNNGGRPDFFEDLIFLPPYWAYDYKQNAFWKLLPDNFASTQFKYGFLYYQRSVGKNSVICVMPAVGAGTGDQSAPYAFVLDFDKGEQDYHWKSQPIPCILPDRQGTLRQWILKTNNGNTICDCTITIQDSQGRTITNTLEIPAGIATQKVQISADTDDAVTITGTLVVTIDMNARSTVAAAIVNSLDIYYYDNTEIPDAVTT